MRAPLTLLRASRTVASRVVFGEWLLICLQMNSPVVKKNVLPDSG